MAKAEPNVVPLCDVLLVLLIIFMVITPMVQLGIDVKLPEVQTSDSKTGQDPNVIVLTVKKNDQVELQRNPLELRLLLEELRRQYAARQDKTIFIRADAKVPFSKVMEVMDICKGAGVETLAIIPELFEE
ncbi:MAG: biopolymer transporter ExbD [Candidatus Aminicenantales bacterium]|jgi:biopolymer transport protein ExbD|nr:biopolymer transporter ExbD [Acidobacteriota bacterium]